MNFTINGFTEFETTKKDVEKLKKSDFVLELEKDLIYLELYSKEKAKGGVVYIIFTRKKKMYTKITELNFSKKQEIDDIKKNKKEIIDYLKLKLSDIDFDFSNSSSKPYGIYKFK